MMGSKKLLNSNGIGAYLHCGLCLEELKKQGFTESPKEYQRIQAGWTKKGLQIWCVRHECNVINIDFEGKKHPANTTRKR